MARKLAALLLVLTACGSGSGSGAGSGECAGADVRRDPTLPDRVARTEVAIVQAAAACDYERLRELASFDLGRPDLATLVQLFDGPIVLDGETYIWPGTEEGGPRTAIDSDGTWLYYESGAPRILAATDDGRIVLLAEDGTELDELGTLDPEDASNGFAVSTDGRFAFFDRGRRSACDAEVVRLNLDTGRVRTIAAGGQPALSPDGRRLAYVGCGEDGDTENRVIVRRLSSARERSIDVEDALLVSRPSWAPDSRHLAVEVSTGGVAGIHVMDSRSSESGVVMLESTDNTFWRGYRGVTGEFYALTAPGGEAGSGSLLPVIAIDAETGATLGTLFELDAQCCVIDLAADREGTAILAAGTNAGVVVWHEGTSAPQQIAPGIRKAAWAPATAG